MRKSNEKTNYYFYENKVQHKYYLLYARIYDLIKTCNQKPDFL